MKTEIATQPVMTSIELVNYINEERKELAKQAGAKFPSKGFAKLEHADFMKKVPEVLGANAGNFSGIYRDTRNREQDCYDFPKREACLMAMSYSYALQAKVFDKMTALEATQPPVASLPVVRDTRTAALIEALVRQDALEQEQQRQALELARIQENVAVIEARTQPENKHFTVLGYSNLIGKKIDIATASRLGRKCAELSRTQGMVIGDVSDPRFGKVHSYHETILQVVLDSAALA